jgi:hypothetical protein
LVGGGGQTRTDGEAFMDKYDKYKIKKKKNGDIPHSSSFGEATNLLHIGDT